MKTNAAKPSARRAPAEVGQASACHAPAEVGQASACHAPAWHPPLGFTLVEVLVVVGIIGMLAAIITPVVMQSLTKARNAAIKAEIDLLHTAIMNYKSEYGSFPPCYDQTLTATSPAGKHVVRIFPRCTTVPNELTTVFSGRNPAYVSPGNAIAFWLTGYTDDPTLPLTNGTRKKLFGFDTARLDLVTGLYWPSGKSGSPYVYIDTTQYGTIVSGASNNPVTVGSTTYRAELNSATSFFNPDTFQILCAGRDEVFGNDDDLSNFWPGTRKEYSESK